jgi:energy-coupling factor transporter ATP-binding protein EcfA2
MNENGLSISALDFRYPSYGEGEENALFEGLDYSLGNGEAGAMLSGADGGKTTLARIIAGMIPRFTGGTLAGKIGFGGKNLLASTPYENVDLIGMISQDSDEQLFSTRCDMEAAFALESLRVPRNEIERRVGEALALMGLSGFEARNPGTLSGGEKKRLLLSCLLAVDPELWILDEAFEELDLSWKKKIIRHLSEARKTALFLDSRWSPLYASHCARISVLHAGKILETPGFDSPGFQAALSAGGLVIHSDPALRASGELNAFNRDPVLSAQGVFFSFPGPGAFSLRIETLAVNAGTIVSLIGRNGSGKSTLGKILCGLLPPEEGALRIHDGTAWHPASAKELSRSVGYLFQNPDYQIFLSTVFDELAYGLQMRGLAKPEIRQRVGEAISMFGLPEERTAPALMSYGARKKLQAATYYLLGRRILILDEMDSGLSYGEYFQLLDALASGGAGIIAITHDLALAKAISTRILLMEKGEIRAGFGRAEFGTLEAALEGEG